MNNIYWVGLLPSYVTNIGDHAQMIAIDQYLAKEFSDYRIIKILDVEYQKLFEQNVRESDLIFIQSGGHFGNLASYWHGKRKEIIKAFPKNRIVQLPISVCYVGRKARQAFEQDVKFFSHRKNLLLLCRSRYDTKLLKSSYEDCKVEFMPDFAFFLNPDIKEYKRNGVLVVLRDNFEACQDILFGKINKIPTHILECIFPNKDWEFIIESFSRKLDSPLFRLALKRKLKRSFPNKKITFRNVQMYPFPITDDIRERVVFKTINYYAKFEHVITDHFHAMVFSLMTNTPCDFLGCKTPSKSEAELLNFSEYFGKLRSMILGSNK